MSTHEIADVLHPNSTVETAGSLADGRDGSWQLRKRSGRVGMDLVIGQRRTNVGGFTVGHGVDATQGFIDESEVDVTGGGRSRAAPARATRKSIFLPESTSAAIDLALVRRCRRGSACERWDTRLAVDHVERARDLARAWIFEAQPFFGVERTKQPYTFGHAVMDRITLCHALARVRAGREAHRWGAIFLSH